MRSSVVPSRIATQDAQRSQASPSWRFVQLTALARIRASEVLPVPRGPTNRIAWRPRSVRTALRSVSTTASWPTISLKVWARQRRYRAWCGTVEVTTSSGRARSGSKLPCTLLRPARSRAHRDERLGPGRSAAPDDDRLVLLPSGPDTVRGSSLRGTRSSTSHRRAAFENGDLGRGFSPAGADCRYRAPLVPRLARPGKDSRAAPIGGSPAARSPASWANRTSTGLHARRRASDRS